MGKRGPKPVPKAAKRRRGTFRPDRDAGTPEPPRAKPRRPPWLGDDAAALWPAIAAELDAMGVLARVDQTALALLCQALADYLKARRIVAAGGPTGIMLATANGNVIQHPAVGVMNKAREALVKLCREFGMTPSARTGLKGAGQNPQPDPLIDMIARRYGSCPN